MTFVLHMVTKLFQELPDTNFPELACTVKFLSLVLFFIWGGGASRLVLYSVGHS